MSYLKSLPQNATLLDLFKAYPVTSEPLIEYHQVLLRGPSPLSIGHRELIAAFVSTLNACHYCHGVHQATADRFGIAPTVLAALMQDVNTAPIEDKLKPILHYVRKVTLSSAEMTAQDAEEVYAAGWDERALHDAVSVCALFNLMNRLVDGLGMDAEDDHFQVASKHLARGGYVWLLRLIRIKKWMTRIRKISD
ncbi:peroxidase-related enzyme [Candidatus Acetothermia bacterium]|nr:peroxidase-related enzyme [Candidatus Acetothermia bacterium]